MKAGTCTRLVTPGVLFVAIALPASLAASPETGKHPNTLSMGADLSVENGKGFSRVVDVDGSFFKVRAYGKEEMSPTRNGTSRMRIDNTLKLAGTPVDMDNLKIERAYTPVRDPMRMLANMGGMATSGPLVSDLSGQAIDNAALALRTASVDTGGYGGAGQAQAIAASQAAYDNAVQGQNDAFNGMNSELDNVGNLAESAQAEIAEGNYDAISISLDLSPRVRLDDPSLLVVARIHERGEKPDLFRNWIFAEKLDPIDSKSRTIRIKQGGLPIGYDLADCQVRLYNHGREVPTNGSPKRVDLSRDEAQQYVLIEHLAAHKGDTMAAAPVFGEAPPDLGEMLAAGRFSEPCFVKVDADGNVAGTFTDKDCKTAAADPYVQSFVSNVLFAPALEKGKPVPGVARVKLGALLN